MGNFNYRNGWCKKGQSVGITVTCTGKAKPTVKPGFKCDKNKGPKKGKCPAKKCPPAPKGCKLKNVFEKGGNAKNPTCCAKPCNYVDAKGKVCKPTVKLPAKKCPVEGGFCVKSNGSDQNSGVFKLNSKNVKTSAQKAACLKLCQQYKKKKPTGCEAIWDQGNRGCYVHTADVNRGNKAARHACWSFKRCKGG